MMTTVTVTAEDIELGIPRDPWECPIARAIARAYGRRRASYCLGSTAYLFPEGRRWFVRPKPGFYVLVPDEVGQWGVNFDSHRPVSPLTFESEAVLG